MWKATIRGLLARRVRLALTAMAVLLGVSFVSATYVLTDTVRRSFDAVFAQTLAGVDLQVQGLRPLGTGDPPRIPESTLDQVRAVPGVARAEGFVTGYAQFVGRDGESIGGGGPADVRRVVDRRRAVPARRRRREPCAATRGRGRDGRGHGARATASRSATTCGCCCAALRRSIKIVGLFGFGDRADFGAVTFAAFDLRTAQEVFDAPGALDRIYVQTDPGVPTSVVQARLEHAARWSLRGAHRVGGDQAGRRAGAQLPRLLHVRAARGSPRSASWSARS